MKDESTKLDRIQQDLKGVRALPRSTLHFGGLYEHDIISHWDFYPLHCCQIFEILNRYCYRCLGTVSLLYYDMLDPGLHGVYTIEKIGCRGNGDPRNVSYFPGVNTTCHVSEVVKHLVSTKPSGYSARGQNSIGLGAPETDPFLSWDVIFHTRK